TSDEALARLGAGAIAAAFIRAGLPLVDVEQVDVSGYPRAGLRSLANFRDLRVPTENGMLTNGSVEVYADTAAEQAWQRQVLQIDSAQPGGFVETDIARGPVLVRLFATFTDEQVADYRAALQSL